MPLEREGLIAIALKNSDRRCKELRLTDAGARRLRAAVGAWTQAQAQFETVFGNKRSLELRFLLRAVVLSDFSAGDVPVIR